MADALLLMTDSRRDNDIVSYRREKVRGIPSVPQWNTDVSRILVALTTSFISIYIMVCLNRRLTMKLIDVSATFIESGTPSADLCLPSESTKIVTSNVT